MQQGRKGAPRDAQGILREAWDYTQSPGFLGTLGEDSAVPPLTVYIHSIQSIRMCGILRSFEVVQLTLLHAADARTPFVRGASQFTILT